MKTLFFCLFLISLTVSTYSQNKCIPYLLHRVNDAPIYIRDDCVDDTLKISLRATLIFNDTLVYSDPVVKSVHLNWLDIFSNPASTSYYYLLDTDSVRSPFDQYLWDLCSAKFTYWYKKQPYKGWLDGRLERGFKLYMGSVFYIVPCSP